MIVLGIQLQIISVDVVRACQRLKNGDQMITGLESLAQ